MGTVHARKSVYISRQEMYPQKYFAFIKTLANGDTYLHFKLKYYIPYLSLEENIGQAHKGEHSTGHLTRTHQELQSWKSGKTRELSQTRGDWGGVTTRTHCGAKRGFWNRKRTLMKGTGEVQVKSGVELLIMDRCQLSFDKYLMIIEGVCYGEVGWLLYGILCSIVETFFPVNLNHSKIKSSLKMLCMPYLLFYDSFPWTVLMNQVPAFQSELWGVLLHLGECIPAPHLVTWTRGLALPSLHPTASLP